MVHKILSFYLLVFAYYGLQRQQFLKQKYFLEKLLFEKETLLEKLLFENKTLFEKASSF